MLLAPGDPCDLDAQGGQHSQAEDHAQLSQGEICHQEQAMQGGDQQHSQEQQHTHAEGSQRSRLGKIGIPGLGMPVASVNQNRSQIILLQIRPHIIGRRIPDFVEELVIARKAALIVDRLCLADQPHSGDRERTLKLRDRDKAKAHALIEFAVQLQPIGIAVFYRYRCLGRRLGSPVDNGRLIVLADTKRQLPRKIRSVNLKRTEKIFSFISTTPFVIFNNKNIFFTYYISKISN